MKDGSVPVKTRKEKDKEGKETGNTITDVPVNKPIEYWEIKMAWSEYRNGKWTQKQQSADAVYSVFLPPIMSFVFVPRLVTDNKSATGAIGIDCYEFGTIVGPPGSPIMEGLLALGAFSFRGSQIRRSSALVMQYTPFSKTDFEAVDLVDPINKSHYFQISSFQATSTDPPSLFEQQPLFYSYDSSATVQYDEIEHFPAGAKGVELDFCHPFVHDLLGKMGSGTLDDLFARRLPLMNICTNLISHQ